MIKARIDVYSHFFKVTKLHPTLYPIMLHIVQELTEVSFVKIYGKRKKQLKKVYASKSADGSERRFHINYLPRFYQYLQLSGINKTELEIVEHDLYEPVDADIKMPEDVVMRDYQNEQIEYTMDEGISKLITLPTGFGKGLEINTPVRIPNGWKPIGELQIGDTISAPDGTTTKVTGIYDHVDKPCYRITFDDGRSCICDEDHLWSVSEIKPLRVNNFEVIGTKELFTKFNELSSKHDKLGIPLVSKDNSPDEHVDIDIDGRNMHYCLFDPQHYCFDIINASHKQRQEYFSWVYFHRGAGKKGDWLYFKIANNEQLIEAFQQLCWSLGYTTKFVDLGVSRHDGSHLGYRMEVNTNAKVLPIVDTQPVPSVPTRCIKVDHPDELFIIKDYIVTHNTFTALKIGELLGKRVFIIILARYLEKWKQDVEGAYGKDCGIYIVKGFSDLVRVGAHAKETGEAPNVTIVSTTVMQRYIYEWKTHQGTQIDGMVAPEDLYRYMGIGFRLIDEAHQHFHANFISDLYTHCPKALYLTATLDTLDKFTNFIYHLMWPQSMRTKQIHATPYDETHAIFYKHTNPDKVRCQGQQGYSHVIYEQSIWKHIPSRCEYLDLIGDQVEQYFLPIYRQGRKMLIFCSLVETCQAVARYLSIRFKDQPWQISKFTAGDPKEIIDTNDITVSTLGKAGTALDVPGLVVCLMTVALAEPKANKQAKGRNRDLSKKPGFEDVVPKFIYFVAEDIAKPFQYHMQKKSLFKPITKAIYERQSGYTIGTPLREYCNHSGKEERYDAWGVTKR